MKQIKLLLVVVLSTLSLSALALPDLNANSLIQCEEGSTITKAVSNLNQTLASSFNKVATGNGNYFVIEHYTSSQPTITKLDNGKFSVCATLTRKRWL